MPKVLITGGAGFIGSHLCKRLLEQGETVVCLDNFFTGRRENIEPLLLNKNFQLLEHDVTKSIALQIDQIYNLACPASPVHYQYNPVETVKTNVMGMLNMLELARTNQARVLQASTSEVYGDPVEHPQRETYWGNVNPIGVRSCYDEGKRVAETLCLDFHRQYNVDVRLVRIFNTYGPNMRPDDGRVVSNFIVQALKNQDLTIYGDGRQTRSFQYVDDLVEGLIKMMARPDFIGPVNIGNPGEFTIKELAEKILKLIPESVSRIIFKPLPSDDPRQRCPDISLAQEKLHWSPTVGLDEGLIKTIGYFRNTI